MHDGRELNVLVIAPEVSNANNFCVVEHLTPFNSICPSWNEHQPLYSQRTWRHVSVLCINELGVQAYI